MLGDTPCMQYAGSNVNLTITVDSIDLMIMESGEVSMSRDDWNVHDQSHVFLLSS